MTKNQSQLIETIKSWRNPYRTHYNDGFNYALTKVIELLESPSEPEAQCICPSGGYDSYCKVHGVLNQQSPEKSSAVLDHRFLPDGMDPGICQKCGSTRTSHRDQQ